MHHLKLVRNMRAHTDPWFEEYLLPIGDGKEETNGDGDVHLSEEICVPCTGKSTDLDTLIENVSPILVQTCQIQTTSPPDQSCQHEMIAWIGSI